MLWKIFSLTCCCFYIILPLNVWLCTVSGNSYWFAGLLISYYVNKCVSVIICKDVYTCYLLCLQINSLDRQQRVMQNNDNAFLIEFHLETNVQYRVRYNQCIVCSRLMIISVSNVSVALLSCHVVPDLRTKRQKS